MLERILHYLEALVACDTQNPPREIDAGHPIFGVLGAALGPGFELTTTDHGKGRVTFMAVRGRPSILFNVHLDTVPIGSGWSVPPLALTVADGRAYGRGACDIKGAAACLLAVAESCDRDLGVVFTTDEEGASGCCVRRLVEGLAADAYRCVIVAEPTGCRPVLKHRGFLSVIGRFRGRAGHSSESRALEDNALHKLSRWAAAALERERADAAVDDQGFRGNCFNIGTVTGGIKSNVIADDAEVRWSARPRPGIDNEAYLAEIAALASPGAAEWQSPFTGPPLPAAAGGAEAARAFAAEHGLEPGPAVDFWTEASLFAGAGLPALVLGPGDNAQAHAVDEWVALEQLERAAAIYLKLVCADE